jgi:hypothetical protein
LAPASLGKLALAGPATRAIRDVARSISASQAEVYSTFRALTQAGAQAVSTFNICPFDPPLQGEVAAA